MPFLKAYRTGNCRERDSVRVGASIEALIPGAIAVGLCFASVATITFCARMIIPVAFMVASQTSRLEGRPSGRWPPRPKRYPFAER
jgi:hypothetical protein